MEYKADVTFKSLKSFKKKSLTIKVDADDAEDAIVKLIKKAKMVSLFYPDIYLHSLEISVPKGELERMAEEEREE